MCAAPGIENRFPTTNQAAAIGQRADMITTPLRTTSSGLERERWVKPREAAICANVFTAGQFAA